MRPEWDDIFLEIVGVLSKRSTCDRGRVSCLIVKDQRIISTGYAGSPIGQPHCDDVGHYLVNIKDSFTGVESIHCIRTLHAEANAISIAARFGIALEGSTLYCVMEPCFTCAGLLIQAGIKRVVCAKLYSGSDRGRTLLVESGIDLCIR